MKILDERIVVQCHVEYDEEETVLLKSIGFLPPYAEPRARLWATPAELEETRLMIEKAKEGVS
jgi:hypothetical protein